MVGLSSARALNMVCKSNRTQEVMLAMYKDEVKTCGCNSSLFDRFVLGVPVHPVNRCRMMRGENVNKLDKQSCTSANPHRVSRFRLLLAFTMGHKEILYTCLVGKTKTTSYICVAFFKNNSKLKPFVGFWSHVPHSSKRWRDR